MPFPGRHSVTSQQAQAVHSDVKLRYFQSTLICHVCSEVVLFLPSHLGGSGDTANALPTGQGAQTLVGLKRPQTRQCPVEGTPPDALPRYCSQRLHGVPAPRYAKPRRGRGTPPDARRSHPGTPRRLPRRGATTHGGAWGPCRWARTGSCRCRPPGAAPSAKGGKRANEREVKPGWLWLAPLPCRAPSGLWALRVRGNPRPSAPAPPSPR